MKEFLVVFKFYVFGSVHVALSAALLSSMFFLENNLNFSINYPLTVFLGAFIGYNFVKFGQIWQQISTANTFQKVLFVSNIVAVLLLFYFLFQLSTKEFICYLLIGFLVLLYVWRMPFSTTNLRNWKWVKIYYVSFIWAMITSGIPYIIQNFQFSEKWLLIFANRFLLIFVLLLIFEIKDLKNDASRLRTIPQMIGIKKTKQLAYSLAIVWCLICLFESLNHAIMLSTLINTVLIIYYVKRVNVNQSKYFTRFWVESVPILWFLISYFLFFLS